MNFMIDNKFSIFLAKNPVLHRRSKHIDTKFHQSRNQVHNGVLEVVHCNTQKQIVDVLTKAIKTKYFINLRNEICAVDFSSEYELTDDVEV